MDYVALLTFRPSVDAATRDGALMRRTAFTYPDGIDVIAEYWTISAAPNVVSVLSTNDQAAMMELYYEWSDVFDITILPAVSAEDGLKIGPDVFGRLQRLQ